jgi:hypothetical protein
MASAAILSVCVRLCASLCVCAIITHSSFVYRADLHLNVKKQSLQEAGVRAHVNERLARGKRTSHHLHLCVDSNNLNSTEKDAGKYIGSCRLN